MSSSQGSKAESASNEPTTQEIKSWDKNKFLLWIQQKLSTPLEPTDAEKVVKAVINGSVFLQGAGDRGSFKVLAYLLGPVSNSQNWRGRPEAARVSAVVLHYTRYADSQLTTSQETDSRPKMWRCPTTSLVSPLHPLSVNIW
jgi:hypothetical protein